MTTYRLSEAPGPSNPLRSLTGGLVLAAALLGMAAPTAQADTDDSGNFSGALSAKGITMGSKQAATVAGHQVCNELDRGMQTSDVANEVMTQTSLDDYHAGFFVGVSIAAFCPRHNQ